MNVDPLKEQLELLGWKHVAAQSHSGEDFDLVGFRQFSFLSQWKLLVKYIDVLDDEQVRRWAANLLHISAESKRLDQCFVLCLVAGRVEVAPEFLAEADDSLGLFGVFGLLEGRGNVFIVDLAERTSHGLVPWYPLDVRKFSRELQAMFQGVFASE